ncbi:MAG: cytochrome c-type biogenesis CcmF C-terminal domain-containing protein [Gemmatimonadota bacterium]
MAELGEFCLWAALPVATLSGVASIAGAWTGRGDLASVGGRAAEAAAVLIVLTLAGLGDALVKVQLSYAFVASYSGFHLAVPWRLAAIWSGPPGGALTLAFLITLCAAVSHRLGHSRQSAARTGCLSVLALFGLTLALVQARPFAHLAVPAAVGAGLPLAVQELTWQVQLWAAYLATACAAFTFAGVTGEHLVESPALQRAERAAVALVAVSLTVATAAAAWRAYAETGELLNAEGLSWTLTHGAAWLLAVAYLHAPGGVAVPAWAAVWARILGVALFPATVGSAAAVVAGQGLVPPAIPWAAGLAVGIVTGAMAGMAGFRWRAPGLERVPGYGKYALTAAFIAVLLAGLAALWALLPGDFWLKIAQPLFLLILAPMAAWLSLRPAGNWRAVWPIATGVALATGVGTYAHAGWRAPAFAVASGLFAAVLVGLGAEIRRLMSARSSLSASGTTGGRTMTFRTRARRRMSSLVAHLGIALVVMGLLADELATAANGTLLPGETLSSGSTVNGIRVTYLGLSRYRIGDLERTVASFMLYRAEEAPRMVTAEMTFDWISRRERWTPAIARGALSDVIVNVSDHEANEAVSTHLASRPLAGAVWLGAALLLLAMVEAVRYVALDHGLGTRSED